MNGVSSEIGARMLMEFFANRSACIGKRVLGSDPMPLTLDTGQVTGLVVDDFDRDRLPLASKIRSLASVRR